MADETLNSNPMNWGKNNLEFRVYCYYSKDDNDWYKFYGDDLFTLILEADTWPCFEIARRPSQEIIVSKGMK